MNFIKEEKINKKALFYWLLSLTIITFLMILIGGLTRLTDSGLSMVDWRPILGTIPPLTNEDWIVVFNQYKNSPEFKIVNKNMELNDFKYIFWWEWFHRFFARFLSLFVPLVIFFFTKDLRSYLV